jgi:uncharacterized protein YecE (DUF72 family)
MPALVPLATPHVERALTIRIGISGWTYPPWRGVFYPTGLRQKDELAYAASQFRTIEINGTFYALQKPESFGAWAEATPEDFVFSVKGSRYVTHIRRLQDPEALLANFMASGLLRLGRKLGPIFWQLPPSFRYDPARIEPFLAALPHDTEHAAALARKHDARLDGRDWVEPGGHRAVRHAMEVRHESFRDEGFIQMLRHYKVAVVCADTQAWPRLGDVTADFIYVRLHGVEELYASGYDAESIQAWANRASTWQAGGTPKDLDTLCKPAANHKRDVFIYFDNDIKVRAPEDAHSLEKKLNLQGKPNR